MSKSRSGRGRNQTANPPGLPRSFTTKTKPYDVLPPRGRGYAAPSSLRSLRTFRDLTSIGDRRVWHPSSDFHRPVVRINGVQNHRLVARPNVPAIRPASVRSPARRATRYMAGTSNRVAFERPQEVLLCVRRKTRREVIHATGVAGRRGIRKYRRTPNSGVGC